MICVAVAQAPAPAPVAKPKGAMAFMKGDASEDSDSDDGKRVVRSHRDKKWDLMQDAANELKSQVKAADWVRGHTARGQPPLLVRASSALRSLSPLAAGGGRPLGHTPTHPDGAHR